jgi:hypothetical protein
MNIKVRKTAVGVIVLLATAGTTAACGSSDKVNIKTGDGSSATVSKDGGKVTVKSKDGSFSVGGDLPSDFPKSDVPLVSGDIAASASGVSAATDGKKGWSVQIKVAKPNADCYADASGKLTGAGFTKKNDASIGTVHNGEFVSTKYTVVVTVSSVDANNCLVSYGVAPGVQTE